MRRSGIVIGGAVALLGILAAVSAGRAQQVPSGSEAERRSEAARLPIADLHLHPHPTLPPATVRAWMDKNGVRWGGGGVRVWAFHLLRSQRNSWQAYASELGARFIPVFGQSELNLAYRLDGVSGLENADNPHVRKVLDEGEAHLAAGRIKGIGTLFINNRSTHDNKQFRRKIRGDAASVRGLYALVARFASVLVVHMEPDADSIAQFSRVLAADRRARVLWNQCGSTTTADQVRDMLARHPNLYCELSWRYPPVVPPRLLAARAVFDENGPKPEWRRLFEDYADRFVLGNDGLSAHEYDGATAMLRRGLLPFLHPATARRLAHENAQRLFALQ